MNMGYLRVTVVSTALFVSAASYAQDVGGAGAITINAQLDRQDAAGSRQEPEYDPQPINVGPLILRPSLAIVAGFDSNVFNRSAGDSDGVLTITPRLDARANLSRHLAEFSAVGFIRRFSSFKTENSEEFTLRGRTRYDLSEGNDFFANASFARQIEARSSVGNIANAAEPVSYDQLQSTLGASFEFGSLTVSPSASASKLDFAPLDLTTGTSLDQSFRDTRTLGGNLSVDYRFSGNLSAFTAASYSEAKSTRPIAGLSRGSDNITAIAGIRGEVSPVITAELAAGYRGRDYRLPNFLDYDGFTYRADVQWYPTELLSVRVQAEQTFLNSGNPQVAGILSNQLTASAYYDPLRNVRLSAVASYEHNKFRETDTRAKRPSMRLQAQFRINPNLSLGTFVSVLRQDVSGTPIVSEFTTFSTGIGISLTP